MTSLPVQAPSQEDRGDLPTDVPPTVKKRRFGALKGKIKIGPEFFDPLPDEELRLWE